MARPGTARARQILYEVARKYGTDPRSVIEGPRWAEYIVVKREFCERVRAQGITLMVAAEILQIDHSTAVYHSNPKYRDRKNGARHRGASDAEV